MQEPGRIRFAGQIQDVVPRELLFDRELSTTEIVLWQYMSILAQQGEALDYKTLLTRLRCSRPTLANALTVLRMTRWLAHDESEQGESKREQGRFTAASYALFTERYPLDGFSTAELGQHISLLEALCYHNCPRIQALACSLLAEAREFTGDAMKEDATEQSMQATVCRKMVRNIIVQAPQLGTQKTVRKSHLHPVKKFNSVKIDHVEATKAPTHPVKNFNSAPYIYNIYNSIENIIDSAAPLTAVQHLLPASEQASPSSTPTTIPTPHALLAEQLLFDGPFEVLTEHERNQVAFQLATLPLADAQAALDETIGVFLQLKSSGRLRTSAVRFAVSMARKAAAGELNVTDAGRRVAATRRPAHATNAQAATTSMANSNAIWARAGFASEAAYEQMMRDYNVRRLEALTSSRQPVDLGEFMREWKQKAAG